MAKQPTITTITTGYTSVQALNDNFEALKSAFTNTISRDGSTPNTMSADFDLNSNDVVNVGAIDADSFILNGTLMTPSGVDPVYSGTISVFGASLIDDADAATARATLSLSTVATSGSYTDLLNLPTLGTAAATDSTAYATAAQGTLADSSIQPTDTQLIATWEAGTGTTESLVSPAKIKASVLANAPSFGINFLSLQSPTSGTAADFTGIPSTATEIYVYFIDNDTSGYYRVQFIVGGVPVTSGYVSSSGTSGAESTATDGFFVHNGYAATSGIMTMHKVDTGTWVESHSVRLGGADASGGGHRLSVGTVDGIRVTLNTGAFQTGSLCVGYR